MNFKPTSRILFVFLSLALLHLSSCTKKQYKCKRDCITLALEGNLVSLNGNAAPMNTPYKILFMEGGSTWIDFNPGREYVVKEGITDASGIMKETIKVDQNLLKGTYSIYVRYFPSENYHFCDNPPMHTVPDVPIDNFDKHTLNLYEKKVVTIHTEKIHNDVFDKRELLFGAQTQCTFGFFSSNPVEINPAETSGDYAIYGLLNAMNILTLKKTKLGNPNTYEWITDSFYVDANTVSHTIQY